MTPKFTKLTVVLAVVALCCFMFAGMAAAAGQFSFTTQSNPIDGSATNYVKADHTYNFDINVTGINAPVEQFTDNRPDYKAENKLLLTFPQGFCHDTNFSKSSVSAYLTIGGTEYGPIQVIPEITDNAAGLCGDSCSVADQVYFTIERQFLPETLANPAYVTDVRITGFKVNTPANPGQFQVCVTHTQTSCGIDACANLNVVKTVGEIKLDTITTPCLYAGGQVTVCGIMKDTCGEPWTETTWPILVELKKKVTDKECGKDCIEYKDIMIADEENYGKNCFNADTCIGEGSGKPLWAKVVHVMTDGSGRFCATLNLPTWLKLDNNEEYVLIARTPEVRDEKAAFDAPIEWKFGDQAEARVPAESIEDLNNQGYHVKRGSYTLNLESQQGPYTTKKHAWLKSNEFKLPEIQPGNPYFISSSSLGSQIDVDVVYPVTICLVDKFCNAAPNKIACGANNPSLKVELRAVDCDNPAQIAGKFYSDAAGTQEIVYTEIPGGATCVKVYFKATKTGKVTLQESAIFGPTDYHVSTTGQCCLEVNSQGGCILEVTNLVTGEPCDSDIKMPKAGWPVKVSLHYPKQATIRVELLEKVGDWYNILPATPAKPGDSYATWDLVAKTDADPATGAPAYLSYDADGQYASNDTFEHNTGVPYNTTKSDFFVYFKNVCNKKDGTFKDFYVKIVDVDNNVYRIARIGEFMPATDLIRILEPQQWQILSTPKTLAGDADMKTLLPGDGTVPYTEILTYKENAWVQVLPSDQLEPLYAYLLNMRQNYCAPDKCYAEDCGEQKQVYAKYVFARAVDPAYAMPATRLLTKGANLIGPSFNEKELYSNSEYKNSSCFVYDGGCCNCPDCDIPTKYGNVICPDLVFQSDLLVHMASTFCGGCSAILNYGGNYTEDCRNSKGNIAEFTTATLGSNNPFWLNDPVFAAYNGDGYLAYLTQSQTMTGSAQLQLINVFNTELYGQ